jgi:hypothetical protein
MAAFQDVEHVQHGLPAISRPATQLLHCIDRAVLLVRPRHFRFNPETAASNTLQRDAVTDAAVAARARAEFDALAQALAGAGIATVVAEDGDEPLPDAVFPNNWLSFHDGGGVALYPMMSPLRRRERRAAVIAAASAVGFVERVRHDFTAHEREGRFLEGTGSLVIDHAARVAYACRSPRTDETLAYEWARQLGYELQAFSACDEDGRPYYHTNVMMWVGTRCAAACIEAVSAAERAVLRARLQHGGRALVELSRAEVAAFCGNMLELRAGPEPGGRSVLVMSATAAAGLRPATAAALHAYVDQIVVVAVPTIETLGGGSVRCMMVEVPR